MSFSGREHDFLSICKPIVGHFGTIWEVGEQVLPTMTLSHTEIKLLCKNKDLSRTVRMFSGIYCVGI